MKKRHIELNGHLEAELLDKEWPTTVFYFTNGMFLAKAYNSLPW